jgi:hypothetical protein
MSSLPSLVLLVRRDRRDGERAPGRTATFNASLIRVGRSLLAGGRGAHSDADGSPAGDQLLDSDQTSLSSRNLDHDVGLVRLGEQRKAGVDRAGRVADQRRRDLRRDESVRACPVVVDRSQQIGAGGQVVEGQRVRTVFRFAAARRDVGTQRLGVVMVANDRFVQDGRVGRDARQHLFIDVARQATAVQQWRGHVVEPHRLVCVMDRAGGLTSSCRCLRRSGERRVGRARLTPPPCRVLLDSDRLRA